MVRKSFLLSVVAASLLISNKNMANDFFPVNPIKTVGCVLGGVVAAVGLYKVGEWCDFWGGPNLQHVLKKAEHTYNATKEYDKILGLYEASVECDHYALQSLGSVKDKNLHAVFLKSFAAENIVIASVAFWVDALQEEEAALLACLQYTDKSSRYTEKEISELSSMHSRVQSKARIFRLFLKDLETHKSYFALYAGEKRLADAYAQERALFNRYASQANTLKAELYAIAARAYLHAWSIVDYAQQLNADIACLAKLIDENRSLGVDMTSACQLYETLSAIHTLIITDRVFIDTAEQYIGWKEEQIRLRHEQERIEQQRRDAARERQRAYEIQAGYQYVNGYYNGQVDASWQTYEAQQKAKRAQEKANRLERERNAEARRADDARNDARRHQQNAEYERAKADRERAEKERLAQERDAENRRTRDRDEQQRQERKRQEHEAARREAERQESVRKKAAEREARERAEAEERRSREREEQQRQERKRKEIEAEKEAARREADRKLEEARYNTFDRFQ